VFAIVELRAPIDGIEPMKTMTSRVLGPYFLLVLFFRVCVLVFFLLGREASA